MTSSPQLCLGTVQFGLTYGVTNQAGQVPEEEVLRILDLAASSGIELLDTAQAYGTAESVLGRCWPEDKPRRLISKLTARTGRQSWETSFVASLHRLQSPKLDGFLLHNASDLLAPDGGAAALDGGSARAVLLNALVFQFMRPLSLRACHWIACSWCSFSVCVRPTFDP